MGPGFIVDIVGLRGGPYQEPMVWTVDPRPAFRDYRALETGLMVHIPYRDYSVIWYIGYSGLSFFEGMHIGLYMAISIALFFWSIHVNKTYTFYICVYIHI